MKAHQRIVREQAALEDGGADLFGQWWRGFVCDIKTANVRQLGRLVLTTSVDFPLAEVA